MPAQRGLLIRKLQPGSQVPQKALPGACIVVVFVNAAVTRKQTAHHNAAGSIGAIVHTALPYVYTVR